MNISAVNSAAAPRACQPIKPVAFGEKENKVKSFAKDVLKDDTFAAKEPTAIEQKYDMACLLAGYYKTQYESLLAKGDCLA